MPIIKFKSEYFFWPWDQIPPFSGMEKVWLASPCQDLNAACRIPELKKVVRFLEAGADPNLRDPDGSRPLHWAVTFGTSRMVEALLAAGADANVRDAWDFTPLHLAVERRAARKARLLLRAGASANPSGPGGETPLMTAASYRHLDMVSCLLDYGADPAARDAAGTDALAHALRSTGGWNMTVAALLADPRTRVNPTHLCGIEHQASRSHMRMKRRLRRQAACDAAALGNAMASGQYSCPGRAGRLLGQLPPLLRGMAAFRIAGLRARHPPGARVAAAGAHLTRRVRSACPGQ